MPLDSNFGDQIFNARCLGWDREFSWRPRRCYRSQRWIWFEYGYVGTAIFTGPGEPVFEHRWHHSDEHLLWILSR